MNDDWGKKHFFLMRCWFFKVWSHHKRKPFLEQKSADPWKLEGTEMQIKTALLGGKYESKNNKVQREYSGTFFYFRQKNKTKKTSIFSWRQKERSSEPLILMFEKNTVKITYFLSNDLQKSFTWNKKSL